MIAAAFAACSGGEKPKGGGAKGSGAKDAGQKGGGTVQDKKTMGTQMGQVYQGVLCDSSAEGIAWCDNEVDIAFCASGAWWLLDCSVLDAFCGDDGTTVDCYTE